MNSGAGLTLRQAWTLEHIVRCRCGMWVVLTQAQLEHVEDADRLCRHLRPRGDTPAKGVDTKSLSH